ncbi:hypothetical protein CUN67_26690 (plasmid) [Pantoea cypripedii]|uniref:Uncharacterized protein n=1 Tax=Pantoea cypripedii TaxID=55209 RepID=A0A6B9G4F0_PANCY|nr:hypothetical protein CUN67_26690 [Pantoea cypripedii]
MEETRAAYFGHRRNNSTCNTALAGVNGFYPDGTRNLFRPVAAQARRISKVFVKPEWIGGQL